MRPSGCASDVNFRVTQLQSSSCLWQNVSLEHDSPSSAASFNWNHIIKKLQPGTAVLLGDHTPKGNNLNKVPYKGKEIHRPGSTHILRAKIKPPSYHPRSYRDVTQWGCSLLICCWALSAHSVPFTQISMAALSSVHIRERQSKMVYQW